MLQHYPYFLHQRTKQRTFYNLLGRPSVTQSTTVLDTTRSRPPRSKTKSSADTSLEVVESSIPEGDSIVAYQAASQAKLRPRVIRPHH